MRLLFASKHSIMPGLVPGIHVFDAVSKTWKAGASPVMTRVKSR